MEAVQSVNDFKVQTPDGEKPCLDVLKDAVFFAKSANDPENAEYFVSVKWLETVPENKALYEVGFFGNQNTVCRPTTPKWRHTVERLKMYFRKWNNAKT